MEKGIREIQLTNFKAFGKKQEIEFRPLTLIYGQNSAGKSSIIQSLALFRQSLQANQFSPTLAARVGDGGLVDLGSFEDFIHDHDIGKKVTFSIDASWNPVPSQQKRRKVSYFNALRRIRLEYTFVQDKIQGRPELDSFKLHDLSSVEPYVEFTPVRNPEAESEGMTEFEVSRVTSSRDFWKPYCEWARKNKEFIIQFLERLRFDQSATEDATPTTKALRYAKNFYEKGFEDHRLIRRLIAAVKAQRVLLRGFAPALNEQAHLSQPDLIDSYIPFLLDEDEMDKTVRLLKLRKGKRARTYRDLHGHGIFNLPRLIERSYRTLFMVYRDALFIGPYRRSPERFYSSSGTPTGHIGFQGEKLTDLLRENPYLLDDANKWLARLKIPYKLNQKPLRDMKGYVLLTLETTAGLGKKKIEVALTDVGFGLSQVLPIMIQCLFSRHKTILIEQPELHIHPALQADLADLFIESIRKRGNQLIIETHSEHFALRILRRIRDAGKAREDFQAKIREKIQKLLSAKLYRKMVGKKSKLTSFTPVFTGEKIINLDDGTISGPVFHVTGFKAKSHGKGSFKDPRTGETIIPAGATMTREMVREVVRTIDLERDDLSWEETPLPVPVDEDDFASYFYKVYAPLHQQYLDSLENQELPPHVLDKKDLLIQYVSSGKAGSVVTKIRPTSDGDFLDDWPDGFFPERQREF